jgi:phospholipase C
MMENRSFDHLLGHLGLADPRIDGLQNAVYNPINPLNASSPRIPVNFDAVDGGPFDPCHSFDCITQQIYGFDKKMNDTSSPETMSGFVANAIAEHGSYEFAMSAFNATKLPVLSNLALEFAVFDKWHCSVPGPTNPNREFLMSGTSHGMIENSIPDKGFPQETHFHLLARHNVSWKIYYDDDPWMAPAFADLRTPDALKLVEEMPAFYKDVAGGTLARYTLIQPRMATSPDGPANWQHPDDSVEQGEVLINDVYKALRASQYWNDTLLIITYDEHGGFQDHQAPSTQVPAPDNVPGENGFDFSRLGIRIPTVMISPWIPKNTVVHAPTGDMAPQPTSQFDATSIISSSNKLFGIPDHMSARDAWAGTFMDILSLDQPRTDCPAAMPTFSGPLSPLQMRREMNMPVNDHHLDSLNLLCYLSQHASPVCSKHASAAQQAELVKSLAASLERVPGNPEAPPLDSALHPHVHRAAAPFLAQRHFRDLSAHMWSLYKARVLANDAATMAL